MTPPRLQSSRPARAEPAPRPWLPLIQYAGRRFLLEMRRPTVWLGVGVAGLLAWAGTHLEILGLDDRPERGWGLVLSTAETLGLLLTLAVRLRGSDLAGAEGWSEILQTSSLGRVGLRVAETGAATAVAWVGATTCATLVVVLTIQETPPTLSALGWGAALLVELAVLCAWLSLAAAWFGRLTGLGVAVVVVVLGRIGSGGAAALALFPAPAAIPPGLPAPTILAAGVAAAIGLTALTTMAPSEIRTFD